MSTSKRLGILLKMTANPQSDPFAWYALALEYRGLGRIDDALATFAELRRRDPEYVPMYLMCGTMLTEAGRAAEAREWLTSGVSTAAKKGDHHAAGELETALAAIARSD